MLKLLLTTQILGVWFAADVSHRHLESILEKSFMVWRAKKMRPKITTWWKSATILRIATKARIKVCDFFSLVNFESNKGIKWCVNFNQPFEKTSLFSIFQTKFIIVLCLQNDILDEHTWWSTVYDITGTIMALMMNYYLANRLINSNHGYLKVLSAIWRQQQYIGNIQSQIVYGHYIGCILGLVTAILILQKIRPDNFYTIQNENPKM